jgi:histidine ammonia-lyase
MLLALRINVLAKGYSGISLETLLQLIDAFNASCLSWVPEKGTVGASGDLAPLVINFCLNSKKNKIQLNSIF